MITNAMRVVLTDDLGYFDSEVDEMRPEIAQQLIDTRTKRPFGDRPMPDAWKRGSDVQGAGGKGGNTLVRLFLLGVSAIAIALATGKITPGQLLGGSEFGKHKLTKLSDQVVKPKKKKRKTTKKKVVRKTSAAGASSRA
jgi:hypothetical protein